VSARRSSPRRERIERSLHRSYWRGTGLNFFFARRIRPAGFGLCVLLITASVLGMGHAKNTVYQLFSFIFALGLIGIPWAFFRKAAGLSARRQLPRYATAGEKVRCSVRVTNHGRVPIVAAWLSETPPDPRPSVELFLNTREPDEEERNAYDRFFAFYRWRWLMEKRRLYRGGIADEPMALKPGESTEVMLELTPNRRGVVRFDDLRVLLPDPFGLFQRCSPVEAPPATLTVLPARYRVPQIELPGSARFQIGGEVSSNVIGSSGEFVGLREYRPGDPLRQIHWKSWARTGRPIVKELENTFFPRYGLVLDTFPDEGDELVFEDAVSIAASFAATIDTRESLLDLMFIKDKAHTVTAGRGMAKAEKLLEVLAAVEPEPGQRFDTLSKLVLRHREELTSCLIVLCGWSDERAEFVRKLSGQGLTCSVLASGDGPAPEGFPGYWIESGQLARDLGRLPVRLKEVGR
jgi:uncharacterized protein (DUF58 family)